MPALFAAVLVGSVFSGLAGTSPAQAGPARAQGATQPVTSQVTLVTGDRVVLSPAGAVRVTPGDGRRGVGFSSYRTPDGHVYVIPLDAMAGISAGRLDRQLFDVTALVGYGYDDQRSDLPLIIEHASNRAADVRADVSRGGAQIGREIPSLRSLAVRARHSNGPAFWNQVTTGSGTKRALRPEISRLSVDRVYTIKLDKSVPQIGAPTAWAAGFDGTGVKVAVLDTGIDTSHPDLAGKVIAAQNFTGDPDTSDTVGHGTHVGSIVAGSGAASGGVYRGVAPGASLLSAKVCSLYMNGGRCGESSILAGMEWAGQQGAQVANMSLAGPDSEGVDPLEAAVNTLTATYHTLFVVAAGNTPTGAGDYSVSSPGTADAALTVGAVDDAGNLAGFSNRGPRIGDTALKPDITAPGVDITAARSSTGIYGQPGEAYVSLSGTSMATPHAAGAAAIMVQRHPGWSPSQIKAALVDSADPNPSVGTFAQGAGRLDVARAFTNVVLADPASISLGKQAWPHGDDPVLTRTVSYLNYGTSTLTLNLSVTARDPNGAAAPAGMFSVSPASLTLPAGGSGTATFTARTAVAGPDGFYGGSVVASAGGVSTKTPFAVDRGYEGYNVTVANIDRNGAPAANYNLVMVPLTAGNPSYVWNDTAGPVTQYVRKGSYLVRTVIFDVDASGVWRISVMVNPKLDVTSAQSLTFDARTAGPVAPTISDDASTRPLAIEVTSQPSVGGPEATLPFTAQGAQVYAGQSDPNQRVPGYIGKFAAVLFRPSANNDEYNSPRSYHLASYSYQSLPTGWSPAFSTAGLARVDKSFGVGVPGAQALAVDIPYPSSGVEIGGMTPFLVFTPPFTHTEYLNTGVVRWVPMTDEQAGDTGALVSELYGSMSNDRPGSIRTESWLKPVLAPGCANTVYDVGNWMVRQGNTMTLDVPLLGDAAGHGGYPLQVTAGQLTLQRNGSVVASSSYPAFPPPAIAVPAGWATYRLEASATRAAPAELSTQISAVWTFGSDTMGGSTPVPLPVWSVSMVPNLNAANTAPAGRTISFPLIVAAPVGAPVAALSTVSAQYSTNDGATWTAATVTGSGNTRTLTVTHPSTTGFVSLKVTVRDYAGNSVEETVLRAYKIAP